MLWWDMSKIVASCGSPVLIKLEPNTVVGGAVVEKILVVFFCDGGEDIMCFWGGMRNDVIINIYDISIYECIMIYIYIYIYIYYIYMIVYVVCCFGVTLVLE